MIQPRLLPIPLPPLPAELVGSYLNRLADANHLTIRELTHEIGHSRHHDRDTDNVIGWTPDSVTNLAVLVGRSTAVLRRALPALHEIFAPSPQPPPTTELIATA